MINKMTKEEALKKVKGYLTDYLPLEDADEIDEIIEALEQTSDDCISRAKALEMLGDEPENWTDTEREIQEVNDYRWFKSILEDLPPVTPQQKVGKWIIIDDCEHFIAKCSECGRIEDSRMINKYPYCHCGAKMLQANKDWVNFAEDLIPIIDEAENE